MKTLTLELPTMYGDHHVVEVRRILFEMAGVEDVYASSGFRVVEVQYDPAQSGEDQIKEALDKSGYLGDLELPVEQGGAPGDQGENAEGRSRFRHTVAYQQTGKVVNFQQTVPYSGRPLWHCPGIGTLEMDGGE